MSLVTSSVSQEIQQIEEQLSQLRHRHHQELKVQLAEARHAVSLLEKKLAEFESKDSTVASEAGKPAKAVAAKGKRTRVSVTISQVVEAIRKGATNYRALARELGCSAITVAKKVDAEGKAAGIVSTGSRATFKLGLKK